ncbi:MAG: Asp-tRNA(Asn)/Glu-tRNA(Gln) amidotransferase subunit GatC [Verrucomicrobia bacterium]|nr:Asp-tRNA(Asn)/Glu-tRNA(Gln) amidotransferase subunit GatC [Verrucomicrobiota bacterium]
MAEFDENELNKLTKLCRIECTEDEKKALHSQIAGVLDYIKQLDEVDTEGVEPCYRVLETLTNVMREDEVGELLSREQFLANAPAHVGGMIRVPPVIKFTNQ